MDEDRIEIISEQLLALCDLWHLLRANYRDQDSTDRAEELLLEVLEIKQKQLRDSF